MRALLVALTVLLGGCGTLGQANDTASAVHSQAGDVAMRWLCERMSVGEWQRRFGGSAKSIDGWRALCSPESVSPYEEGDL